MKKPNLPNSSCVLIATALTVSLAGCGVMDSIQDEHIDYKSAGKGPTLSVPPDLTQLTRDSRYAIPGVSVTASGYQSQSVQPVVPTAAVAVGDVRIERAGNQRWLVVNRPAEKLWEPVREFWQESGFLLTLDQENLGIMETDFAENRAKIPQDFIRSTIGKVLDSLYSTSERDKFRTRLERNATGGTEIYVSHRGMVETVVSLSDQGKSSGDNTVWQPRPADPELEAEFLRRLMVKLGVSAEQSKVLLTNATVKQTSRLITQGNTPVVQLDDGFERAWRRVGLALDRTGFTVEDRDRAQGIYFVRYVEPTTDKKETGFFSKLFTGTPATPLPLKYRIAVRGQGDAATLVSVLNEQGQPETSSNAQRIAKIIADDLK